MYAADFLISVECMIWCPISRHAAADPVKLAYKRNLGIFIELCLYCRAGMVESDISALLESGELRRWLEWS